MNTYNAVPGNVNLASAVQISVPADAVDTLAVSTVNTPLQKEADYLEAIRQALVVGTSILSFAQFLGNNATPGTTGIGGAGNVGIVFWAGANDNSLTFTPGNPVASDTGRNSILMPVAGKLYRFAIKSSSATPQGVTAATGVVTFAVFINGVANATLTISPATNNNGVSGFYSVNSATGIAVNAGDFVSVQVTTASSYAPGGSGGWLQTNASILFGPA